MQAYETDIISRDVTAENTFVFSQEIHVGGPSPAKVLPRAPACRAVGSRFGTASASRGRALRRSASIARVDIDLFSAGGGGAEPLASREVGGDLALLRGSAARTAATDADGDGSRVHCARPGQRPGASGLLCAARLLAGGSIARGLHTRRMHRRSSI